MTTLTTTSLDKRQITLTLRSTKEIGAEPNVFVSAEEFARFKAEAASYDRDTAIAELKELRELALANKDYDVVRKIVADILRLKQVRRGTCYPEIYFPADADLAAIPVGASFDEIVQAGLAYAVKSFHANTKKEDLAEINSETALHDSAATEQANQRKNVASIVGERMKLLEQKHNSKEFTREVAYASFEELRRVSMLHGGLNTARLLIRDKCRICDIPSFHQRKSTKSQKELTAPTPKKSHAPTTDKSNAPTAEEVNASTELKSRWKVIYEVKRALAEQGRIREEERAALEEEGRAAIEEEERGALLDETNRKENMNRGSGTDPP